ncbi:serine/arginine repetitive matrix protein 1-like isoform X2 [Nilaparvata lugens]|uniref:serine/arginine repetitive matrix protein 1-like isoform X2 n=1 Tax=Nilaparvata lugens TaxID=108931 RepID=UPI00193D3935|nr:serine/arginine repetitive matrix protein 1-like isoform X2 [Nilaparvata lugens]
MSRRRTPSQLMPPLPPRIRSQTPPPPKLRPSASAMGQRSPPRRARSPQPMRAKRPLRNNTPPHRRSPMERRPSKGGTSVREFVAPPPSEREPPHSSPRPRGKRDFRSAGISETVTSRSR